MKKLVRFVFAICMFGIVSSFAQTRVPDFRVSTHAPTDADLGNAGDLWLNWVVSRPVFYVKTNGINQIGWTEFFSGSSTMSVNGTPVSNPNLIDSSTATISVTSSNVSINPTNIENAQISVSAAIGRSKVAAGTASHVVINDGSGNLSSEAQLSKTRGGTGVSSTATFPSSGAIVTEDATETFTGKTYDAAATGNVLKFTDYKDFIYPSRVDGTGCIIGTTNTANVWGLASYSGTADTNGNYAFFRIGTVPYDLDTGMAMTLKGLSVRVDGSDTDAAEFTIALYSPASSASGMPSDFTACSTFLKFDTGTLTSPAAGDTFFCSDVTLTGWASALTAGRPFIIGIARRNGNNDDIVSVTAGTIEYGRTK